jgi:beta-glucanase (GH16 family)
MYSSDFSYSRNTFILFNVAVGGKWLGSPDGSTLFPQEMKVDYIRVFQKK